MQYLLIDAPPGSSETLEMPVCSRHGSVLK